MQCTKEAVGHVLRVSAPRSQVDFQNILDTIEAMSVDYTKQNLNSTLPNSPSLKSATPKGIEMPNTTLMTESKLIDQQSTYLKTCCSIVEQHANVVLGWLQH